MKDSPPAPGRDAEERVQLRVHGVASLPTLVFLPGLHGDWTLIGSFRQALGGRLRFVEVTYPRTLTWSLEEYAAGVEDALAEQGIAGGWLLGESFSSQVVWPLLARNRVHFEGLVLAGGFVRHPLWWGVPVAERILGGLSLWLITCVLFGYARIARLRFRRSPEVLSGLREFMARRTNLDRQAAVHRLHLIAHSNPSALARRVRLPVFALAGSFDPVVPWGPVRRWLKRHCPGFREFKVVWGADHNVLSTAPRVSARFLVRQMIG